MLKMSHTGYTVHSGVFTKGRICHKMGYPIGFLILYYRAVHVMVQYGVLLLGNLSPSLYV